MNLAFPIPKLMCSVSKAAITNVCVWILEGITGKKEEIKQDPDEEESISEGVQGVK